VTDDEWFNETLHQSHYACCATVRTVVTSARLDGREVDTSTYRELHDVYMGEQTADVVVDRAIREGRFRERRDDS
jgi:hypothetical protein